MINADKPAASVQVVMWADETISMHATALDIDSCGFSSSDSSRRIDISELFGFFTTLLADIRCNQGPKIEDPATMTRGEVTAELPTWKRLKERGAKSHRNEDVENRLEMLMDRLEILSAEKQAKK